MKKIIFMLGFFLSSSVQSAEIEYKLLHASNDTYVVSNYVEQEIVYFSYEQILSRHNNILPKAMKCIVSGYREELPDFNVMNNKDFSLQNLDLDHEGNIIIFDLIRNNENATESKFMTTTSIKDGYKDRAIHCVADYSDSLLLN